MLCNILRGEASEVTLTAIINLLEKTMKSLDIELVEHFSDVDNLLYFFESLGVFVDPDLCKILEDVDTVTGELTCREMYEAEVGLREALEKNENLSEEEIKELLDTARRNAEQRAKSFDSIMDGENIQKSIGPLFGPGNEQAAISTLPASFKNSLANSARAIFDVARGAYVTDLSTFIPSLYLQVSQLPQLTDDDYDAEARCELDEALHKFNQIQRALAAKPLSDRNAVIGSDFASDDSYPQWSLFNIRELLHATYERSYYSKRDGQILLERDYNKLSAEARTHGGNWIPFHPKKYIRLDSNQIEQRITSPIASVNTGWWPQNENPRWLQSDYNTNASWDSGVTFSANLIRLDSRAPLWGGPINIPIFTEQSDDKEDLGPFTLTTYKEFRDFLKQYLGTPCSIH